MKTPGLPSSGDITMLLISIFTLFTLPTNGQNSFDSVDSVIHQYMQDSHNPGFVCGVVKEDKLYWYNAYGKANIGKDVPMSMDAIMNIGSISKTFTATAVMQLWEKGLVRLDSDINDYLGFRIQHPQYPDTPITIFQLLTHTSAICDGSAYGNSYACGDPTMSLKDWIYNYLTAKGNYYNEKENFCQWAPGDKRRYSNVAYGLLGYIVEKVSGMPFHAYCKQHIFLPLGMKHTGWLLSEIDTLDHIIPYNYIWSIGLVRDYPKDQLNGINDNCPLCLYSFPNYPDGLVRTSVRELSYFLIAMISKGTYNGASILKASTVEKMLTLQLDENGSQGLCWSKREFEGLWGHSGSDPGIETNLFFSPETKIGVITFQNSSPWRSRSFDIVKKLYSTAKEQDP